MKKKALVTGGAGFVGSHLVDSLIQKDFFVYSLDTMFLENQTTDANSSGI